MKPERDPKDESKDSVKSAPEEGDALTSGRSRGRPVDDSATKDETERAGEREEEMEAPESGRHDATRPTARPDLGTQGT